MPTFRVSFPERVVGPVQKSCCQSCMTSCSICSKDVKRGVTLETTATNKREAWDRYHREFPFESIVVTEVF